MATIYKEIAVEAPAEFVWDAIKDVAAVHTRLARGFVTNTVVQGDTRSVTFANGFVVQEQIVAIDEAHLRMAYRAIGGRASHHNASFQVFATSKHTCRLLWITDLLPEEVKAPIEQMVEAGSAAMKQTLEHAFQTRS